MSKSLRLVAVFFVLLLGVGLTFVPRSIVHATDYSNTYWWSGGSNCNGMSTPVLTWNGLQVCEPGSTGNYVTFPGGASVQEWQCTELVDRYLFLAFGAIPLGSTNGNQVVDHYSKHYPSLFRKVANNGTHHVKVGDVLSYYSPDNHTAIVKDTSSLNSSGTGTITVIEQNASPTGQHTQTVTNWVIQNGVDDSPTNGNTIKYWFTPRTWGHVKSPTLSTTNTNLYAVTATSSSDVWTVGFYYSSGNDLPLAIHWGGSSWGSNTISGNIPGILLGVSAISSSNVLAVGAGYSSPLAFNFTTGWAPVPSDNPGYSSSGNASFAAVGNDRNGDAWAVGTTYSGGDNHIVIEQYGGSSTGFQNWTLTGLDSTHTAVIPNLPGTTQNVLNAVTVYSATDVWAVGRYLDSSSNQQPLLYHYNGSTWTNETAPIPSGMVGANLKGVTELSANNVWAVGYSITASGYVHTYTINWNGSQWNIVASSNPSNVDELDAVTSVSDATSGNQQGYLVYAVGETILSSGLAQTLVLVYGSSTEPSCSTPDSCSPGGGVSGKYGWLQVTSPNVGSSNNNELDGVTIAASGDTGQAWAVGWYGYGSYATLTERSK